MKNTHQNPQGPTHWPRYRWTAALQVSWVPRFSLGQAESYLKEETQIVAAQNLSIFQKSDLWLEEILQQ